jgi:ATP-dependent Clp protease adaptor protein ClpS
MPERRNDEVLEREPITKKNEKLEHPRQYQVIFLNDDWTEISFVVDQLKKHFHHSEEDANAMAQEVHTSGKGIAGCYQRDIAETKAMAVMDEAKAQEFPLQVVIAPDPNSSN